MSLKISSAFLFVLLLFCFTANSSSKKITTYKVLISFHSIGTGVPDATPLEEFIQAFKTKHKVKEIVAEKIGPLGREGEYQLGFQLKELNKKKKALFISEIEKTVALLKDRGSASFEKDGKVDFSAISERATCKKVKY